MMTASPGHMYEHDILGNRTYRNPSTYTTWRYVWDEAGRMVKAAGPDSGATYTYRADGMRVRKVDGLTLAWIDSEESASGFYDEIQSVNNDTWRYRYDGQMCFEEDLTKITGAPGNPVVTMSGTSYALGARGIDMLRPFSVDTSTFARTYYPAQFPIYDGHGNLKCTLTRSGSSPWYTISNSRSYDVWGGVRDGSASGDPNTRNCANLGHKQDDESATFVNGDPQGDGLIYMRARYYEPGTGRFVSEDPARDGWNWYVYCNNNPTNLVDRNGKVAVPGWLAALAIAVIVFGFLWAAGDGYFDQMKHGEVYSWERIFAKGGRGALAALMAEVLLVMMVVPMVGGAVTGPVGLGIVATLLAFYVALCAFILSDIDEAIDQRWPERS